MKEEWAKEEINKLVMDRINDIITILHCGGDIESLYRHATTLKCLLKLALNWTPEDN